MNRVLRLVLIVGLVIFIVIQFVGPFVGFARTNPASDPNKAMTRRVAVPVDIKSTLDRSCKNCHSNETVWPWYSHVAPVSWNVIGHVNDGRGSMNLSDWPDSPEEGIDLLDAICDEVKKGKMPIPQYTWMHSEAKLSDVDKKRLCEWANQAAGELE